MKKIFLAATILFLLFSAKAQVVPQAFNYQTIVRSTSTNEPITSHSVCFKFTIEINNVPYYIETHTGTTNQFGLYTTQVGTGTVVYGNFAGIPWGSSDSAKMLLVEMDLTCSQTWNQMG